jgi:hypothetical protein
MSRRVIWQQCYDHNWTIHIPWPVNKDYGWSVHACVAVIEDGGAFILELSVNGQTKDINLANVCVPIPVGPITVQACIANLNLGGGNVAFDLVVKACIDVTVGPIHLNQCVNLVSQHISIHLLAEDHHAAFGIEATSKVPLYAYITTPLTEKEIATTLSQPQQNA